MHVGERVARTQTSDRGRPKKLRQVSLHEAFANVSCGPPAAELAPRVGFGDLPHDILESIGKKLGPADLSSYAATCRELNDLVDNRPLLEGALRIGNYLDKTVRTRSLTPTFLQRLGCDAQSLNNARLREFVENISTRRNQEERVRSLHALQHVAHRLTDGQISWAIGAIGLIRAPRLRSEALRAVLPWLPHLQSEHIDELLEHTAAIRQNVHSGASVLAWNRHVASLDGAQRRRLHEIAASLTMSPVRLRAQAEYLLQAGNETLSRSDQRARVAILKLIADYRNSDEKSAMIVALSGLCPRLRDEAVRTAVIREVGNLPSAHDFARALFHMKNNLATQNAPTLRAYIERAATLPRGKETLQARAHLIDILPQLAEQPDMQQMLVARLALTNSIDDSEKSLARCLTSAASLGRPAKSAIIDHAFTEVREHVRSRLLAVIAPHLETFDPDLRTDFMHALGGIADRERRVAVYDRLEDSFAVIQPEHQAIIFNDIEALAAPGRLRTSIAAIAPYIGRLEGDIRERYFRIAAPHLSAPGGQPILARLVSSYTWLNTTDRDALVTAALNIEDATLATEALRRLSDVMPQLSEYHRDVVKIHVGARAPHEMDHTEELFAAAIPRLAGLTTEEWQMLRARR